ncbi:trans-sulfuration enzyme family protein [Desulfitobacterium sp. AusDCA]|uniref:trans-sulfuration enzyme family protein n=1 Tax=Desulfitobacterium sp. AusDCA TaxID=3240383 RepID=UPI003DA7695D
MKITTHLAQIGNKRDATGAISFPVYHSSTFSHQGLGKSTGYDYSRSQNPTREVLEEAIARLEGGDRGFAFSSGMAAISTIFALFRQGDHFIVTEDCYGGTFRLFHKILNQFGLSASFVDTSKLDEIKKAILPSTKAIFCETPTNPMMRIANIKQITLLAKSKGTLTIIDNTFLTPLLQKPIELRADIVVHSGTKYLGGHNDVLAGLVVIKDHSLAERFGVLQNAIGAVLGPQECWLLMRGMKTLALRVAAQEKNAQQIARWLVKHPLVEAVYYPGLESHSGHDLQLEQASGFGSMMSFTVKHQRLVRQIVEKVKIISFAESLGGVESLITFPTTQTHAEMPSEMRERSGVTDCLLRLSVGIEDVQDLIEDLEQAFSE